jgi:hypothetical protein
LIWNFWSKQDLSKICLGIEAHAWVEAHPWVEAHVWVEAHAWVKAYPIVGIWTSFQVISNHPQTKNERGVKDKPCHK